MTTLALLQDGSCSIKPACLQDAGEVAPQCPQLDRCGSCVMWSPRAHARSGRNEGICLLDPDARKLLDCGAAACPYYRPRRGSPALDTFSKPRRPQPAATRTRERPLGREAPAPSPAALATRALGGAGAGVLAELALELVAGPNKLPPLLERFRGGTAVLKHQDGATATVPVERWYLWICAVQRTLNGLEDSVLRSALAAEDKEKIRSDLKAMRGTMTTFNVLFRDKEDHFVGQKSG